MLYIHVPVDFYSLRLCCLHLAIHPWSRQDFNKSSSVKAKTVTLPGGGARVGSMVQGNCVNCFKKEMFVICRELPCMMLCEHIRYYIRHYMRYDFHVHVHMGIYKQNTCNYCIFESTSVSLCVAYNHDQSRPS